MLRVPAIAGATLVAAATVVSVATASPAGASICDPPINGTFTRVSDGVWAKTNDSYHNEETVTDTWTVSAACTDYLDCTGQVVSSQGWTASAKCYDGLWYVRRQLEHWEPCLDGTGAPAQQTFMFAPDMANPTNFAGSDKTVGASGGCGFNKPLTVEMPLELTRVG
ncbi:hypothetical protein [Mycobacterium sp.]|uniref:hypothetical protein n=1 Tax=Mycobacterium sp. TaxID=1785 RepID=UPI002CC4E206|nr:hypothetical protein [Mycobacterium sp.]HME49906.1 hypothetical protein [Mycobacterium sp.]